MEGRLEGRLGRRLGRRLTCRLEGREADEGENKVLGLDWDDLRVVWKDSQNFGHVTLLCNDDGDAKYSK